MSLEIVELQASKASELLDGLWLLGQAQRWWHSKKPEGEVPTKMYGQYGYFNKMNHSSVAQVEF